ncbi:MAG: hypothetical protein REH83_05720, partial [Rickettsiella sp.]|nr:hypothetical protein [Rickettsiella sp.]
PDSDQALSKEETILFFMAKKNAEDLMKIAKKCCKNPKKLESFKKLKITRELVNKIQPFFPESFDIIKNEKIISCLAITAAVIEKQEIDVQQVFSRTLNDALSKLIIPTKNDIGSRNSSSFTHSDSSFRSTDVGSHIYERITNRTNFFSDNNISSSPHSSRINTYNNVNFNSLRPQHPQSKPSHNNSHYYSPLYGERSSQVNTSVNFYQNIPRKSSQINTQHPHETVEYIHRAPKK